MSAEDWEMIPMLLGTMSMGDSGAGSWGNFHSYPLEMHSACPRIMSCSWLNNPMTLDTKSRFSDRRVLVVQHGQMFAKGGAEDLQLYHRLGVGRPAQHTSPDCPIPAGSVEPQSWSQQQTLRRHG